MATRTSARKQTTAKKTAPAKKTTPARKPAAKKALPAVKAPALPVRPREWMTDVQGYATLAARIAGIPTPSIREWRDHRDGTATRPLADGSTLHYDLATRTLTWQAVCPMGAIHVYRLSTPSANLAARIHADRCQTEHHDLTTVEPLTADELAALGILAARTVDVRIPGDPKVTETLTLTAPEPAPRALADELVHSDRSNADTQPIPTLAADEPAKEHPQP